MNAPLSPEREEAAAAVASYLDALRVSDVAVRERVTARVLERVAERAKAVAAPSPASGASSRNVSAPGDVAPPADIVTQAMRELDRLMNEWFAAVLAEPAEDPARLSARGRLALLLVDLPGRWPAQFLQPAPWPPEFVRAMRESFLHTRPDDHRGDMQPEPIDLGAIAALTRLSRLPYYRILLVWLAFALLLVAVFRLTH